MLGSGAPVTADSRMCGTKETFPRTHGAIVGLQGLGAVISPFLEVQDSDGTFSRSQGEVQLLLGLSAAALQVCVL